MIQFYKIESPQHLYTWFNIFILFIYFIFRIKSYRLNNSEIWQEIITTPVKLKKLYFLLLVICLTFNFLQYSWFGNQNDGLQIPGRLLVLQFTYYLPVLIGLVQLGPNNFYSLSYLIFIILSYFFTGIKFSILIALAWFLLVKLKKSRFLLCGLILFPLIPLLNLIRYNDGLSNLEMPSFFDSLILMSSRFHALYFYNAIPFENIDNISIFTNFFYSLIPSVLRPENVITSESLLLNNFIGFDDGVFRSYSIFATTGIILGKWFGWFGGIIFSEIYLFITKILNIKDLYSAKLFLVVSIPAFIFFEMSLTFSITVILPTILLMYYLGYMFLKAKKY
jgi:hypothetical protein